MDSRRVPLYLLTQLISVQFRHFYIGKDNIRHTRIKGFHSLFAIVTSQNIDPLALKDKFHNLLNRLTVVGQ